MSKTKNVSNPLKLIFSESYKIDATYLDLKARNDDLSSGFLDKHATSGMGSAFLDSGAIRTLGQVEVLDYHLENSPYIQRIKQYNLDWVSPEKGLFAVEFYNYPDFYKKHNKTGSYIEYQKGLNHYKKIMSDIRNLVGKDGYFIPYLVDDIYTYDIYEFEHCNLKEKSPIEKYMGYQFQMPIIVSLW